MQENINQKENQLFPEDPEAPKVNEYKKAIDYGIFILISLMTLLTVALSLYIIIAKYF